MYLKTLTPQIWKNGNFKGGRYLKKVQVAMGSGTGFSSEFSGQVNFTWFT